MSEKDRNKEKKELEENRKCVQLLLSKSTMSEWLF